MKINSIEESFQKTQNDDKIKLVLEEHNVPEIYHDRLMKQITHFG